MLILLTGAASDLGRALATKLATEGHQLRLVDAEAVDAGERCEPWIADLTDSAAMWRALRGVDAVVHTGEAPANVPGAVPGNVSTDGEARAVFLLDYYTRGTHVLFKASVEAGVRRFVYGSTLDLFRPYADDLYISEMWRPLPTPDIEPMARYLGELTCREFARDYLVGITALRLGTITLEEDVVGDTPDLTWLDRRDAVCAFQGALQRDTADNPNWSRRWGLFHVCATPPNPKYISDRAAQVFEPQHNFSAAWAAAEHSASLSRPWAKAESMPSSNSGFNSGAAKKKVLFLGASGLIGPFLTPGLESEYELSLADVKPHPDGIPVEQVDVTDYAQVLSVAEGHDAIMNYTVVRSDADLSFHVNVRGAWNVMRAAAELGIPKVLHSGPEYVRPYYDHEFDIDNPPHAPGTGWYGTTKMLSREICRIFARTYGTVTPCYLFNGLGAAPTEAVMGADFAPFTIVWEDLQHACRLALEIEELPNNYEEFNLHSHLGQGKFSIERAQRILGYEPTQDWARFYRRPT
jgi:nucleoside-diphosphate-sugar epimerase